jgi:hypothetical protein
MGSWLAWEARNLGMPKWHLWRMGGNIGVDFLLGAIPWVGAIPDFFFKSNSRNLRIVKRWLDKHHPETMIVEGEVVARRTSQSSPSQDGEDQSVKSRPISAAGADWVIRPTET